MAEISCPSCRRLLHTPEGCTGLPVQCATCRHAFTAPPTASLPGPASTVKADDTAAAPERFRRPLLPHRGGLILGGGLLSILAVLGLAVHVLLAIIPLLLGSAAWVAGGTDLRALRAGQVDPGGAHLVRIGRSLGLAGAVAALVWLSVRIAIAIW